MERRERAIGGCRVVVLSTVRGLVKEADEVRQAFEALEPQVIALPIGPREREEIEEALKEKGLLPGFPGNRAAGTAMTHTLTGLPEVSLDRDDDASDYEDFGLFVSTSDMLFLRHLSRFGNVEMPPPSFQEAVRQAMVNGRTLIDADFDDDGYTTVFLDNVSTFGLIKQGRRMRKLARARFKALDPDAFAREWDLRLTQVRGYRNVEFAREEKIAASIAAAADGRERLLAIVEAERLSGVWGALERISAALPAGGKRQS